jgi:hypothetical protein
MTGVAGQRLDPATVNRQIGRILQQSQRAAARFAIVLLRPVQAAFEMHGRLRNARRAKVDGRIPPTAQVGLKRDEIRLNRHRALGP